MSGSNSCLLTCKQISQEAGKVGWYSHFFKKFLQFVVIHTVKGFCVVSEAEVFFCFVFGIPLLSLWSMTVGYLISGPSAFSKTSLNIRKFTVHVLLKAGLENFEHYFTSMWDECSCVVVWAFFDMPFFEIDVKIDLFQFCSHCWVFQIYWHTEWNTFTTSSFRILNSSVGIPSPPLVLFILMLPTGSLDFVLQHVSF